MSSVEQNFEHEVEEAHERNVRINFRKIRKMSNMTSTIKNEKKYIFISYAHKDIEEVFPVIEELQQQKFCLWYDEGVDPGSEWDDNIAKHVENCTIMISFISRAYLDSENCKDELNYARDLEKKRLLVYIEDVQLSGGMRMRMGRQQAIYYYKYFDKKEFYSKLLGIPEIEECKIGESVGLSVRKDKTELELSIILEQQRNKEPTDQWEQYNIGYSYEFGTNGLQDYEKAVYWYRKSAEQGNAWSQNRLGDCYRDGKGVNPNLKIAVEWYTKAGKQGDQDAQYKVGLCYSNGNGVDANDTIALQWYIKAAEQGHSWAQYAVGFAYEFGKGVCVDYVQAVAWYRKSADQGNAWSQNRLGDCFFNGNGVTQDYEEAVRWYEMAAQQEDVTACSNLAHCYRNGYGVIKDTSVADYWALKAKR